MSPTPILLDSFMLGITQSLNTIKNIKAINELHSKFTRFNALKQLIENSKQGIDKGRREAGSGKSAPAYSAIPTESWKIILKLYKEIFYKCKELSNEYKEKLKNVSIGYINRPFIEICEILYTIETQLIFHGNNVNDDSIKSIVINFFPIVNTFFTEVISDFKKIIDGMSPGELYQLGKCADPKILESLKLQASKLTITNSSINKTSPSKLTCDNGLKNMEDIEGKEKNLSAPITPHSKKIKKSIKTPYTVPSKTNKFMTPLVTTKKRPQPHTCSKITENTEKVPELLKIKEKLLNSSMLRQHYISEKRNKVINNRQKHEQQVTENKAKQKAKELLISAKKSQKYKQDSIQPSYNNQSSLYIGGNIKHSNFKLIEHFIDFIEYKIFSLGCATDIVQLKAINKSFKEYLLKFKQKHYDQYSNPTIRRKIGKYNNIFGSLELKLSRKMINLVSLSISKKILSTSHSPEKSICDVRRNIERDFEQDSDITPSFKSHFNFEESGEISTESLYASSSIASPFLDQEEDILSRTFSEDMDILGSPLSSHLLQASPMFLPQFKDKRESPKVFVGDDSIFLSKYAGTENLDEIDEKYMSAAEEIHQKFLDLLTYKGDENLDDVDENIMWATKELHTQYRPY